MADLYRKQGWAASWGTDGRVVGPDGCARLHPLLDRGAVLGGLHVPADGLAKSTRAVVALARRAGARGATFLASTRVTGPRRSGVRFD